jgi:hypothetical protein
MEHAAPIIAILGIGTAVPRFRIDQEDTSRLRALGQANIQAMRSGDALYL